MSVDVDALVALSAELGVAAERVGRSGPETAVTDALAAMPGSDTAAVLAPLPDAVARAVAETAGRIRSMAGATARSAVAYADTDAAVARKLSRQLDRLGGDR
ncbi:hypothetical protein ACFYVR_13445 [Rhodococcus sp. NPDC003318]|uniref:hypothetical protein n=1 Tax=Rhodococcus sp. NPDC003318 TaxID=3364503 RepID=UPI0036B57000